VSELYIYQNALCNKKNTELQLPIGFKLHNVHLLPSFLLLLLLPSSTWLRNMWPTFSQAPLNACSAWTDTNILSCTSKKGARRSNIKKVLKTFGAV